MDDDDRVFKALADATRRHLLDRLRERDGRTLTELESGLAMSRFGVPTRGEIKDLTAKVDALTHQVDLLVTKMAQKGADGGPQAVYYVVSRDDGWVVGKEGMDQPIKVYPTKEDALEEARVLANKHAPSRLHVYKKDGTIQDTFTYGD